MDILLQLFLIVLLIGLNGFFVISEYALVNVRRTRIELLIRQGDKKAKEVADAINDLPTYISSTQLGITFASIALGWIGEPAVVAIFNFLFHNSSLADSILVSSQVISIILAFLLITFLEVVFGEIAPKTTALEKAESISLWIITPLRFFTVIFKPFIWLLRATSQKVVGLIGLSTVAKNKNKALPEEEIKLILAQSAKSGEIDTHEVDIINRVFQIGDLPVAAIMIPLHEVVAFNEMDSIRQIAESITEENMHTRFPIYEYSKRNIIGYIGMMDIYILESELAADKQLRDTKLIQPITKIEETARIDDVLVLMKKKGLHLGVVVNKKDETVGIVSIEDIIESLVGEIKGK